MPLYEYRCLACGHVFDVIQKFSDPPLTTCPECGKAVEKCVSSPAIQFKGSGFYITDYTNKGKKPGKAKKAKPAKPAEKAKESKPKAGGSES
jgi:putative FmdB family regulatory protein